MSRKSPLLYLIRIAMVCFCAGMPVAARTWYVCNAAAGSGDGASWDNAFRNFAEAGLQKSQSSSHRGDTFFIAAGPLPYEPLVLRNQVDAGNQKIFLCKATEAEHGLSSGWRKEYADGQVLFRSPVCFESDGWCIDGATGGGPGSWDSGYGIKIFDSLSGAMQSLIRFSKPCGAITVRHVECSFDGNREGATNRDQDAVYAIKPISNVHFADCAFKYPGRCHFMLLRAKGLIVERCYHLNNRMATGQHAESWSDQGSDSVIIRDNVFRGCQGTGIIVVLSRGRGCDTSHVWKIYGNIFDNGSRGYVTDGVIAVINKQTAMDWLIANNTFIDIRSPFHRSGCSFGQSSPASGAIRICNNAWIRSARVLISGGKRISLQGWNAYIQTAHDKGAGDTVIISDAQDTLIDAEFRLSVTVPSGKPLPEISGSDMLGTPRGLNSAWGRGAIEKR